MGSGLKREHHRAQRVQLRPRGVSCSQSFDLRHLRMKRETTRMKPVVTSGQNAAEP
jgi:hypothetical protein